MSNFLNYKHNPNLLPEMEIVERKGIGHPDTIADALGLLASYSYSEYCLKHFNVVPHHRFDKTMVIGGRSKVGFGVGEHIKPIQIIYVGKVSESFGDQTIPWQEILIKSTQQYLKKVLPNLDSKWLDIKFNVSSSSRNPYWFKPRDINDIPDATSPKANDTSITIAHAPLTQTEQLTLALEKYFYHQDWTPKYPFIGHDIKVLTIKKNNQLEITLCVPFLGQNTPNEDFYYHHKDKITQDLIQIAQQVTENKYKINLIVNSEDYIYQDNKKTPVKQKGHYLLVSGSALDHGEEGVVGRGNKTSGVISTFRAHSMEAPYGKNPAYYTGVIYAYVTQKIANQIHQKFNTHTQVIFSSRNGDPVENPHQVLIETSDPVDQSKIEEIVNQELQNAPWTKEIVSHRAFVPVPLS